MKTTRPFLRAGRNPYPRDTKGILEEEARPIHTHTASEENEDKRRPRGMQVGAKLT